MLLPLTWQVLAIGVAALLAIAIVTRDVRQTVKVVGATMWAWLYPLASIIYDTFMIPWGLGGMPTLSLVVEVVSLYIVIGGMPALIVLLDGNKTTARRLIIGGDRIANGYCVARLASCLAIALGVQGMANLGLRLPDWLAAVIAIVVIVLFYIRCMPKISAIVSKTVVSDTDEADAAHHRHRHGGGRLADLARCGVVGEDGKGVGSLRNPCQRHGNIIHIRSGVGAIRQFAVICHIPVLVGEHAGHHLVFAAGGT